MSEKVYSIGPIMKAARKFKKLNQADVAQAIGCSQSALSKMEHNLLVPSAPQWFLFSRFTAIPPEALETGIIDRHSAVKFNNAEVSLGFKIPKRYRHFRAGKVREIYPFLKVLEPRLKNEFIRETGLDPEFFLDFDNLVNFHLIADVINYYIKMGKGSPDDIQQVVKDGQDQVYWDHYDVEWRKLTTIQQVLSEYAKEQLFFQSDFQLKVESGGERILLSYFPEYHLKQMGLTLSPEFLQFINLYRKYSIENLLKKVLDREVSAELVGEGQGSPLGAKFKVQAA